jgi:nuclear pore complex protein Nup107
VLATPFFKKARVDRSTTTQPPSAAPSTEHELQRQFAAHVRQSADPFTRAQLFGTATHAAAARLERDTWYLLQALNADRNSVAQRRVDALQRGASADVRALSLQRRDVADSAAGNDDALRELQLVIAWLQRTHDASHAPVAPLHSAWFETARTLGAQTQLDPDAPLRAHRGVALVAGDVEDERRLLAELWRLVRGGRIDDARQLCRDADQAWRAAALGGDELSLDKRHRGVACAASSGNFSRCAWKAACLALAHAEAASPHERALHGALCGSLRSMLLCCHSYDDYLWAHLRAAYERRLEAALEAERDTESLDNGLVDLSFADWTRRRDQFDGAAPPPLDVRDIVALLRKSSVVEVREGAREPFRRLQTLVIHDDVKGLLLTLVRWLDGKGDAVDVDAPPPPVTPQLLRFAAHVALFFNAGGLSDDADGADACTLLRAYVAHLMHERETALVAQYVALLPNEAERIDRFVQYMSHITDAAARQQCIVEAEKAGLDVAAVTRNVVERARTAPTPAPLPLPAAAAAAAAPDSRRPSVLRGAAAAAPPSIVSSTSGDAAADETRVRALGWLCFDPLQRTEAMRQANALMREFVCEGKLERCEQIVGSVLPADALELVDDAAKAAGARGGWHHRRIAREHRELRQHVHAMRAFELWLEHWTRKPAAPTPPIGKSLYSDEVMYKRQLDQHEAQNGVWQTKATALLNEAHSCALRVLQAPEGFLIDRERPQPDGTADPEPERAASIQRVRAHALPTLYLALSRALLAAGRSAHVAQLACLLADDRMQLLSCFSSKDLTDVLETCRRAAIASVADGRDTVGFPLDVQQFLAQAK